jgi:hypothetical protein
LSIIGFILAGMTGDSTCHRSASKLLEFVRRKQLRSDRPGIDGGIPGSWPIRGRYNAFEIPNWGVKFFVDALIAEHRLKT